MVAGIASLISYASTCDAMLVPVHPNPSAILAFKDATHPSSLSNYGERGWCRLENYVALCISEIREVPLPLFAFGINKQFHRAVPEAVAVTGMYRPLGCLAQQNCERLKQLGGAKHTLGAVFSEKDLPHTGKLSVEGDRQMVKAVEEEVRKVYILHAIRSECRRVVASTEEELRRHDAGRASKRKSSALGTSKSMVKRVVKDHSIRTINLTGKQLHDEHLELLGLIFNETCTWEATHEAIVQLEESEDFVGTDGRVLPWLEGLRLPDNDITATGIGVLHSAILSQPWCQQIRVLDLSGNSKIGDRGMNSLMELLVPSRREGTRDALLCVGHLVLVETGMTDLSGIAFLDLLTPNPDRRGDLILTSLDIRKNFFRDEFRTRLTEYRKYEKKKGSSSPVANDPPKKKSETAGALLEHAPLKATKIMACKVIVEQFLKDGKGDTSFSY